ncbi:hypothetical protein B0T26DRAFT_747255 [Lasiosphaeria miniovina]|uniref:Uncharacterized protein n=1 Tax=Lasiosphaeria miniovina TaxID=1954250 RepID=A0AA40B3A3_9PEZI|nr:uncharacterized protein B0T26DRAFT_747255 [Lasiosphaeria miniovina]KAK0726866.1 hypothetical protein B0T26DRAFT_747255 [Lasiosphaeria miniovina]
MTRGPDSRPHEFKVDLEFSQILFRSTSPVRQNLTVSLLELCVLVFALTATITYGIYENKLKGFQIAKITEATVPGGILIIDGHFDEA